MSLRTPDYPHVQRFTPVAGAPAIYQPLQYSSSTASSLPPPPSSSAAAVCPPQILPPAPQSAPPPMISGAPPVQGGQPFSPPPLSSGVSFQHGGPGSPTAYLPPVRRASGTETEPALIPASQRTGLHDNSNPRISKLKKKIAYESIIAALLVT